MEKFGLIGEHLGHSYSRFIHNKFGEYEYEYLETDEAGLKDVVMDPAYGGFNVTIPYKVKVMEFCDEISDEARKIGAVNTIVKRGGKIKGYNTDYFGFKFLLERNCIDIAGKKCLVLGSGGASRMVQVVLADLGAREVVVISRTSENNYDNIGKHRDADIIVNATPVGMYPNNGASLINLDDFDDLSGVCDLIYNPNKTKLILDAMEKGIPACGGLSMLVAQAKQSSELFQDKEIDDEEISAVIYEVRSATLNIILIGMPGAGKTYLGRKIAEKEHRKFIDLDDMIVEREGMSIPEIFEQKGEDYFRNIETEALRDACKETGIVIACGGGIVKRRNNYAIAKQNGRIIWVKRDLDKLEKKGRPISQKMSAEEIFAERKDAYKFWSDYFIDNNQDFN